MNKAIHIILLLLATTPLCAQSDAYLHYSQNPNLDVAFIENLRIDDTIILDKERAQWVSVKDVFTSDGGEKTSENKGEERQ